MFLPDCSAARRRRPSARPVRSLVVPNHHALVAQVVAEGIGDLVVEEGQQPVAGVDQIDLHIEIGEDRRILAADHPGAVDGDPPGRLVHLQHPVAVDDVRITKVDVLGPVGSRSGRHDDVFGRQPLFAAVVFAHHQGVRINEPGEAVNQRHPIAGVEAVPHADLFGDDAVGGVQQLRPGHVHPLDRVLEQRVMPVVRQQLNGMSQGLARDGPLMGATATHLSLFLDHYDPFPGLGKLHRRAFAARSAANHRDIVMLHKNSRDL